MITKKLMFTAVAVGALFAASPLAAAPIVVGQWYTFGFAGEGSSINNGSGFGIGADPASIAAPDSPWTFDLDTAGALTVVDGFNSGDQFAISDSGNALGNTSAPLRGADCGNDITGCLANASMSKGSFGLAAGSHSITGTALLSPFGGGAAFFQVSGTAAVPEPATWAMMLLGFGGIGMAMRRSRQKTELPQIA